MEAKLVIAIDLKKGMYRTLKTEELQILDMETVSRFKSSEEVRQDPVFRPIIEKYLAALPPKMDEDGNYRRKYPRGSINIICTTSDGFIQHLMAFYRPNKEKLSLRFVKAAIRRRLLENPQLLYYVLQDFKIYMLKSDVESLYSGLKRKSKSRIDTAISQWFRTLDNTEEAYYNYRVLDRYTEKYVVDKDHKKPFATPLERKRASEKEKVLPFQAKTLTGTLTVSGFSKEEEYALMSTAIPISSGKEDYEQERPEEELFAAWDLDDLILSGEHSVFQKTR